MKFHVSDLSDPGHPVVAAALGEECCICHVPARERCRGPDGLHYMRTRIVHQARVPVERKHHGR